MKYFSTEKKSCIKTLVYMMTLILMTGLCAGCAKEETESKGLSTESESSQVEEHSDSAGREDNDIKWNDKLKIDFSYQDGCWLYGIEFVIFAGGISEY